MTPFIVAPSGPAIPAVGKRAAPATGIPPLPSAARGGPPFACEVIPGA